MCVCVCVCVCVWFHHLWKVAVHDEVRSGDGADGNTDSILERAEGLKGKKIFNCCVMVRIIVGHGFIHLRC